MPRLLPETLEESSTKQTLKKNKEKTLLFWLKQTWRSFEPWLDETIWDKV